MLNECCAVGVNYVACGIDWREGDVVVLTEHEHPSNRVPWYSCQAAPRPIAAAAEWAGCARAGTR